MAYTITRQTGSHIRLTTDQNGQHHITIPNHDSLKIGTLSSIIADGAQHFNKTKDEIMQQFFG
jgi:predicted RNA binding protein YcfA (HicA-like mRNA interferase family)